MPAPNQTPHPRIEALRPDRHLGRLEWVLHHSVRVGLVDFFEGEVGGVFGGGGDEDEFRSWERA